MLCPKCHQEIPDEIKVCPNCGIAITQPAFLSAKKSSKLAKTALVFTILAVIGCPLLIFGPIALALGAIELYRIKKGLSSPLGRSNAMAGIIIGLIATLIIPLAIRGYYAGYIRSKVGQARGDMRIIAIALESYFIDWSTYPTPDYAAQGKPIIPQILTAPIDITSGKPYLYRIPNDRFSAKGNQPYRYFSGWTETNGFWILASNGPDKKIDLDVRTYNRADPTWLDKFGIPNQYDPTNGTISSGDIWRYGP